MRPLNLLRVLVVAAALLLPAATAHAIGTAGVELLPQLPRGRDGRFVWEVGNQPATAEVLLENLNATSTQVHVYAVAATVTTAGDASLGPPGSAPWLRLDEGTVELTPRGQRRLQVTAEPGAVPAGTDAAIVLESRQGPTLITRVASVVRLTGAAGNTPLPRWVLLLAAALLVLATGALSSHQFFRDPAAAGSRAG